VIIGPRGDGLEGVDMLPSNVHLLGPRPYASVPAYMAAAGVGLIPFRTRGMKAFVDDINPLKLYEYMAAGLPVVTTPIAQVAALSSPARVAEGPAAFADAIRAALADETGGTAEKSFAAGFDWGQQFLPLVERLGL
jgi:glycosyltransferase involved in cell wall biosynthesis